MEQQKQQQQSAASAIMTESHSVSYVGVQVEDEPMCRICHNTGGLWREALVRACWCKGSVGSVHKSCLETWLRVTNKDTCPICTFRFHFHHSMKPLWQWAWPRSRAADRVVLSLTVIIYIVLVLQLAALCLLIVQYRRSTCYTPVSIGIAAIVGGLPWLVTGCIGITVELYYSDYWVDWRKMNRRVVIELVDPDEVATAV